jgi:hypothetical protein
MKSIASRSISVVPACCTVGVILSILVLAALTGHAIAASAHSPWDCQNVAVILDRGNYWTNETMTIQTFMLGNFSNTLEIWLSIVNDSGASTWQENWQPNATLMDQVHTSVLALWNQTIGHYTIQVTWDHRMTTVDFWLSNPGDLVPVAEFQSSWLMPLTLIPVAFFWRKRSCRNA